MVGLCLCFALSGKTGFSSMTAILRLSADNSFGRRPALRLSPLSLGWRWVGDEEEAKLSSARSYPRPFDLDLVGDDVGGSSASEE